MAESRTEKEIDADVEEAMKRYYMKKIKEKLKTENRLSKLKIVYYILVRE